MQPSKQNTSKETIDLEIYNTFEQFKQEKNIKIVDYLKKLDVKLFKNREYRSIDYTYESFIRFILFQRLKGIRFQTELVAYLKRNPSEKHKLGFSKTPNQRTISNFQSRIIDKDTKKLLKYTARKIEEISEKFGILLDVKTFEPNKPNKKTKIRNQYLQKNDKTKEICKLLKKRLSPFIKLNLNHNTVYTKNQFIDLMIHMSMTKDFAENGSKTFRELRTHLCPNADTLLYHLKNYSDFREIQQMYLTLFEILWNMTKQTNTIDVHRRYDVAIDFTEWYFYGDGISQMVMGKKPDLGTTKCYKFATINIVESGKRFTLLALPVGSFDSKEQILKKLLSYAQQRIKINRIYADRGFFDSNSINIFKNFRNKFLIPCSANSRIKRLLDIVPSPAIIKDYEMGNSVFNVVIVEDENGNKRAFATNEIFDENDVNLAERLFLLYGKRWGIETSYRVKKHSFLPRTTSKNYQIRIFYFLFSVLLYTLWLLADIMIWLALFGYVKENHLITSKYFGTVLYTIDPGGG